jgi:hypothetical protein
LLILHRYVAAVYVGAALGGNFMSYKMCPNNAVGLELCKT